MRWTIEQAWKELKTVIINYTEKDGSNEWDREIEPYSFREKEWIWYFFWYDISKWWIRQFIFNSINKVEITSNNYEPRWEVEF